MLTPEQRTLRARIAVGARWARATNEQRRAHAAKMVNARLAKYFRTVRDEHPEFTNEQCLLRAVELRRIDMMKLSLKASRARAARKAAA